MAYNLGPVLPHVKAIAESVGPRFGIVVIHGWRASDPFIGHPEGRALDFMSSSQATRFALAEYIRTSTGADQIIRDRQIWTIERAAEGWRPYSGKNPHTDHVHGRWPAIPGSTNVGFGIGGSTPLGIGESLEGVERFATLLGNPGTWVRVSMFIGGVLFLAIGILGITRARELVKGVIKS